MTYLSRRSILRGSLAAAATRPFVGPHIAKAAATTASVWFAQGFVQDEDVSQRKAVAEYEKQSGNKIELKRGAERDFDKMLNSLIEALR